MASLVSNSTFHSSIYDIWSCIDGSAHMFPLHTNNSQQHAVLWGRPQACAYVVNDCQDRGEVLVELQALNSTAAARHRGDWQGKIDLRASKHVCGPCFPSSAGAWFKFVSETTDAYVGAVKASEVNRWEIESQPHLSSFNNDNSFVNYLIVYADAHPRSHPLNIYRKYISHPDSTPNDGGYLSINLTEEKALTWPPNSPPTSSSSRSWTADHSQLDFLIV